MKKKSFKLLIVILTLVGLTAAAQTTFTFTGKPIYKIQVTRGGIPLGDITVELFPKIAPLHVRNFDSLVSVKFYDTTAFHRVIPGFMIQGGDPNSRHGNPATWGQGQPSQPKVNAEFNKSMKHTRGMLSAARTANDTNSATSQFFICVATASQLDGQYSLYGRTISGMNWVDTIVNTPRNPQDRPLTKIEMFITRIGSNDTVLPPANLTAPPIGVTGIDTLGAVQLKWSAVPGTYYYHLDVSTDSMFVNDTIRYVNTQSTSYTIQKPRSGTTFYWRVLVNNGGHIGVSARGNFTTKSPDYAALNVYAANDQRIYVYPTHGSGEFRFHNLEKGAVVEIYDITGKLIHSAEAEEANLSVDLEKRNKGIYIYKVQSPSRRSQHGKLIIE